MIDPFKPLVNLNFVSFNLSEILRIGIGFDARNLVFITETVNGVVVREGQDNPFIVDNNGNKLNYQRDLVWGLEDKQLLIDAMYNHSDIGKFVVVRRDYNYIKEQIKKGNIENLGFHELVDGKQRLNTVAEFMQGKFCDSNGIFYFQYSIEAQRHFCHYRHCTIAILENPAPAEIKRAFLNVNFTGKPMSKEHIEFVKSINL